MRISRTAYQLNSIAWACRYTALWLSLLSTDFYFFSHYQIV